MRAFGELCEALDTTSAAGLEVDALVRYFRSAPPADCAWATWLLGGRRPKRFVAPAVLRAWLVEASGLPEWLVNASNESVGDLAETIALLMETDAARSDADADLPLAAWLEDRLPSLREADEERRRSEIVAWWRTLPSRETFILGRLLTGTLRVTVPQPLLTRAIAAALGAPRAEVARRIEGEWQPSAAFWESLRATGPVADDPSAPYPFLLASQLKSRADVLGNVSRWLAEWKWDGIRAQLVRRGGRGFLWSRDEHLLTDRFPEVAAAAAWLPDGVVLDGELVAWQDDAALPRAHLEERMGRRTPPASVVESTSVRFLAFDLLEQDGRDIRSLPLAERRARLESLVTAAPAAIADSPAVRGASWQALEALRAQARSRGAEGLMLKALDAPYGSGRLRGAWWKWKIEPYSVDAVLLYAQPGGLRAEFHTEYTFGLWRDGELVPVAKISAGLSRSEAEALDRWIRLHTRERFGPVRRVEPTQVFEIAYDGVVPAARRKAGVMLRSPRILRWRRDKPAHAADSLDGLPG